MSAELDAVLSEYRNWLLKTAWDYADNATDVHDLAQEGHIEMWRELTRDGLVEKLDKAGIKLSTHLMNKARWRMADVRARGSFTGKPSQAGKKHSAGTASNRDREQAVDMTVSDFDFATLDEVDAALVAYHHGEIVEAINRLPIQQRERVYARFWQGAYDPKNSAWWFARRIGAKDRLLSELSHLEGLLDRVNR